MIDNVPLIQNANDAQQINASIIAMKKASRELDEKIVKLNSLNSELDKKIALLDSGLNKEIEDRKEAINSLDVASVGGSGKYISAISETDGKISATAGEITSSVSSGNSQPVTSGGVAEAIGKIIYDDTITDCNNAFERGKTKTYWLNSDVANVPTTNNGWYIISQCNPNQVSANNCITQIATVGSNVSTNEMYIRHAYLSGSSVVFSSWKKLIKSANYIYVASTTNVVVFNISSFYGSRLSLHFKFSATGNANRIHIAEGTVSVWDDVGRIEILYKGSYISDITIDTQAKTITVNLTERTYSAWLSYEPIIDFALVP